VVSAPAIPASAAVVDITSFGAVCNGAFNNTSAIAAAIASAKSRGLPVFIPAGTCAYGDVIRLDGVKLIGAGDASVLYALDWSRESIFLYGSGSEVRQLKLSGVKAPSRQEPWEATRIALFGASNFVIDNVTIDGSAAAGIQTAQGTNNGRITNNRLTGTLSDSIHITDRASYLTVEGNRIDSSGDDGIAVVSYRKDGGLVDHITARNNVVVNNRWGRQMSVVGGSNVLYENNYLENNSAAYACVYIAQEAPWATYGAKNVVVQRNTLKNCGGVSTGHGAVMVFSDGQEANTNITLSRNDIVQNGQRGIRVFSAMNTGITLDSNRIQGASPALDISSPGVTVIPFASGSVGYIAP
jgi:Pectate lyase superfamily protein